MVKVRLESVEQRWRDAGLQAFVSDENQIIILASDPAHKLRAVTPLSPQSAKTGAQPAIPLVGADRPENPAPRAPGPRRRADHLSVERRAPAACAIWRSASRWPTPLALYPAVAAGRNPPQRHQPWRAGGGAVCLCQLFADRLERAAQSHRHRLAAREALQRANNALERRIAERTADLRASNARLKAEIREREHTELTLRRTQDDLIQAGKLAVIGQMATSIAHELNQPLAALRTLSGNTVRFLERGKLDVASANLGTINQLVDRMGKITASLRSFARRPTLRQPRQPHPGGGRRAVLVEPRKGKAR